MRRNNLWSRTVFLLAFLYAGITILSALGAKADRAVTVGWVSDIVGDWTADGHRIGKGVFLPAGAMIKAKGGSNSRSAVWRIHIQLDNGDTRDESCSKTANACSPIKLPDNFSPETNWLARLVDSIERVARGQAPSVDEHLFRKFSFSTSEGSFRNAALELDGDRLSIAPLFADLRPGKYVTIIAPADQRGQKIRTSGLLTETVTWDRTPAAIVTIRGLKPGLYVAESPTVSRSLVLVVDRSAYPKVSSTFAQLSKTTNGWRMNKKEKDRFLRAALIVLSSTKS